MNRHVAYRAAAPAFTWVRIHQGMEPAVRSYMKRGGIKGCRFTKDCGEVIVKYPIVNSEEIEAFLRDFQRVRSDSTNRGYYRTSY